jgi:4-amino-4-deoxy-L-arabinose transferase-like glycosyltransferase
LLFTGAVDQGSGHRMTLDVKPRHMAQHEVPRNRYERALAPWCQSPARLLAALTALHVVLWIIVPSLVHQAPPIDVVEGYMWGPQWVLATYKHPALPSWLIEASRILTFGATGWPVYVVSQIFVAATLAVVYCLGRDLMDAPRAAAGAISLMAVEYLSWMSPQFNHNIAQLPFWVGSIWCVWRAVEATSGRQGYSHPFLWWAALGLVSGAGLYSKLSHGMILLIIAGWMLFDPTARRTLLTPGPWLAVAVCAVVVAPLLHWLIAHDFQPLTYAAGRGTDPVKGSLLVFLPSLVLISAPILLLASATGTFGTPIDLPKQPDGGPPTGERARAFLMIMTLVPIILTISAAVVKGAGLRASWTAPMLMLVGPAAIMAGSGRWGPMSLVRQSAWTLPVLVIIPVLYAISMVIPVTDRGKPIRVAWPAQEIASRLGAIWTSETGKPLKIIAGEAWVAGLVGIPHRDRPSILTDGNFDYSPWIAKDGIARNGVFIVWDERTVSSLPQTMRELIGSRPAKRETFRIRGGRGDPTIELGYVIIPPRK